MNFLQKIPSWLKNKYILTAVGFVVWMFFFDERDIITTHIMQPLELKKLQQSEKYYQDEIKATKTELESLKASPSTVEA